MRTNQIKATIAVLLSVSLLSGCYPTGNEVPNSNIVSEEMTANNTDLTVSNQIVGDVSVENPSQQIISYNLTMPKDTPSTIPQICLQVRKWEENEIESIFLDGKTVVEQYTYEPDFFPDDLRYVYKTSDDWQIIHAPGQLVADNYGAMGGGGFQYGAVYPSFAYVCFANDEELSAFSRDSAVKRVDEILDKLNIPYGDPYIIPIKADTANKYLESCVERQIHDGFSYTPWTEENEIYVLIYPLVYEGIELTMQNMRVPGSNDYGSGGSIEAVVSKDDIISISGHTIFQSEYENEKQVDIKFDANFGLNKIKDFYSSQIISKETEFFNCKLIYAPVKKESEEFQTFAPVWEFDGNFKAELFPFKQPLSQYVYTQNGNRYSEY